jgi:hypothetical protein
MDVMKTAKAPSRGVPGFAPMPTKAEMDAYRRRCQEEGVMDIVVPSDDEGDDDNDDNDVADGNYGDGDGDDGLADNWLDDELPEFPAMPTEEELEHIRQTTAAIPYEEDDDDDDQNGVYDAKAGSRGGGLMASSKATTVLVPNERQTLLFSATAAQKAPQEAHRTKKQKKIKGLAAEGPAKDLPHHLQQ